MERKGLMLALLIILSQFALSQMAVGNFVLTPKLLLKSSNNFTLFWQTYEPSTSMINCSGPGVFITQRLVEPEPSTDHTFSANVTFASEGVFGCTVLSFPINGSPVTTQFTSTVHCEGVRLELDLPSLATIVRFNRPRGSGPYQVNLTVKIRNACVGRANVSVSSAATQGISLKADRFTLFGLDSFNVPVNLTVPDSTPEGAYYGSMSFSASGSSATSRINISVRWPSPKLAILSKDLGNVKSGSNSSVSVEVKEVFGYRAAENVSCSFSFQDSKQKEQQARIKNIAPFGRGLCGFMLRLPDRDVVVGNYSVYVRIESVNTGSLSETVNYTLPVPYVLLAPKELKLGKITFETGKDSAYSMLTIMENGGFTPIEGITFRLIEGEEGWVFPPACDYVPPGGRANCTFRVVLSDNASIGAKEWTFEISSRYTSKINLVARAEVYFIGIEDALAELEAASDYGIVSKFTQGETLKTNAEAMLNVLRGGNAGIPETATAISIHGGVTSLLSQMDEAHKSFSEGDSLRAGRSLLGARMALDRISSSYRASKINDTSLLKSVGAVYASSAEFWSATSKEILAKLEEDAYATENINYMKSAEYYSILEQLNRQNDTEKSAAFARKALGMGKAYSDSVAQASALKTNGDRLLRKARAGTVVIGSFRIIADPFSYTDSVKNYRLALSDYEAAAGLYRAAGQQNDLNKALAAIQSTESEYSLADTAFSVGTGALSILLILGIIRVTIGMQQYREDEEDIETGGVMVR